MSDSFLDTRRNTEGAPTQECYVDKLDENHLHHGSNSEKKRRRIRYDSPVSNSSLAAQGLLPKTDIPRNCFSLQCDYELGLVHHKRQDEVEEHGNALIPLLFSLD